MAVALAYPDKERVGRGNKLNSLKIKEFEGVNSGYLSQARFVLRHCRDKAKYRSCGFNPCSAAQQIQEAPTLAEHGGDRKSEAVDQGSVSTLIGKRDASYLAARLKRDAPDIAERKAFAAEVGRLIVKLQENCKSDFDCNLQEGWLLQLANKTSITPKTAYNWWSAKSGMETRRTQ